MGIALNMTAQNGARLEYGRINELETDYMTRHTKAFIAGYTSKMARHNGERPQVALVVEYTFPNPIPENVVGHAYEMLAAANPALDMTEI